MTDSRSPHGALTEPSRETREGKGREGKGREGSHVETPSISISYVTASAPASLWMVRNR